MCEENAKKNSVSSVSSVWNQTPRESIPVDDSVQAIFQENFVEINEQTNSDITQPQIVLSHFESKIRQLLNGFEFNKHF